MKPGTVFMLTWLLIASISGQEASPPERQTQCLYPVLRAQAAPRPAVRQPQVVRPPRNVTIPAGEKALRNWEELITQMNFVNSNNLNLTLNDSNVFTLNGRMYGFRWENNRFVRLPYPLQEDVPPGFINFPNEANVLATLKNRFAERPRNATQTQCPLYMQVQRQDHYYNRFNRIVLIFSSPCMPHPKYKILLHKSGLRQMLVFNIGDKKFRVQFGRFRQSLFNQLRRRAQTFRRRAANAIRRNRIRPNANVFNRQSRRNINNRQGTFTGRHQQRGNVNQNRRPRKLKVAEKQKKPTKNAKVENHGQASFSKHGGPDPRKLKNIEKQKYGQSRHTETQVHKKQVLHTRAHKNEKSRLRGRVLQEKIKKNLAKKEQKISAPKQTLNTHNSDRKLHENPKKKMIRKLRSRRHHMRGRRGHNRNQNRFSNQWRPHFQHRQQQMRHILNRFQNRFQRRPQQPPRPQFRRRPGVRRMLVERYTRYRLLNPVHHAIQYYPTEQRPGRHRGQFPVQGHHNTVQTPEALFTQQAEILNNLRRFYRESEKIVQEMTRNGTYTDESVAHAMHWSFKTTNDQGAPRFEISPWEYNMIRAQVDRIVTSDPQRLRLCRQICRPSEYYYSWDFCLRVCRIRYEFLSNTRDVFTNIRLYRSVPWRKLGRRNRHREIISSGEGDDHFWQISALERFWEGNEIESCPMTWTSIECNF